MASRCHLLQDWSCFIYSRPYSLEESKETWDQVRKNTSTNIIDEPSSTVETNDFPILVPNSPNTYPIAWLIMWFLLQLKHNIHIEITTTNTHYSICMAYNTSLHVTSPFLGQYLRWSGGRITVPVWDWVTGLVVETSPSVRNPLVSTQTGSWYSGSDGSVLTLWHLS